MPPLRSHRKPLKLLHPYFSFHTPHSTPLTYRDLVTLGPGSTTPVVKPLPSFPLRQDSAVVSADALPHNLLLLDIQQATCAFAAAAGAAAAASTDAGAPSEAMGAASKSGSSGNGGTEQGRQIYCTVHLGDAGSTAGASASPASRSDTRGGSSSKGFRLSADAPVRTRALALGDGGVVAWQERLILALPMRLGGWLRDAALACSNGLAVLVLCHTK